MIHRRFIFVEKESGELYISPQINGCKEEIQGKENCPNACVLSKAELLSLFRVRNLDSFRQACDNAAHLHCTPLSVQSKDSAVSKLDLKQLKNYPADRYIFVIDNQPIPAPKCWDGGLQTFYALVSNIGRIAQALNSLLNTQGSGATIYKQVLRIPNDVLDTINGYLHATCEEEYQNEDNTIIYTAKFPDGREMDVKCCGCQDDCSWTEAVLFDAQGRELTFTEPSEEYSGLWDLECDGITYIVNVVPADNKSPKAPPLDEEGVCPVCRAELEYVGPHEILDDGSVIPWKCPSCGATGKEGYTCVFDRHYDVCTADGRPASVKN